MKTILILGGTGFIGECFIDFFSNKELKDYKLKKLILVGRNIKKIKKKYKAVNNNIVLKKIDLNKKIVNLPKADFVLHAAENYSNTLKNKIYSNSYNLTKKICNYYKNESAIQKLIFISSGSVYGNNQKKLKLQKQKNNKKQISKLPTEKKDYALNKYKSEKYIKNYFKKI